MFVSVDPLVTTTGEPYIYGSGNPITRSDPTGLCSTDMVLNGCRPSQGNRYGDTGRRGDRRERGDEVTGGTGRRHDRQRGPLGITDLDSDWVGRSILDHYLRGGGVPMMVINDPDWDAYLRDYGYGALQDGYGEPGALSWYELLDVLDANSLDAIGAPTGLSTSSGLSIAFPNGEGILGTNYLHGSNAEVGGFVVFSQVVSSSSDGGSTSYVLSNKFIINDVIDPNSIYWTDRVKSAFAEAITLGGAQGYDLSIFTTFETTLSVSPSGTITGRSGWPYG